MFLYPTDFKTDFDKNLLEGVGWSMKSFTDHHDVAQQLKGKKPYTVTVIIDSLDWRFGNNKKYVIKSKHELSPLYNELLFKYFYDEFGTNPANEVYAGWLKKYHNSDETIKIKEMEPRYRRAILKRFKNHDKLFAPRTNTDRERIYNLPDPLNRIDWRNPYDNIFVWEENGKKLASRGGSGSSGGRERNSILIYGLLELDKTDSVMSYLFLYNKHNELLFGKSFPSLCIPRYDIGSNYPLSSKEDKKLRAGATFLSWDGFGKMEKVEIFKK